MVAEKLMDLDDVFKEAVRAHEVHPQTLNHKPSFTLIPESHISNPEP